MKPATILAVIVNYRTAPLAVQALKAILPEVRARGDTQIVLVDNGSGDGSAALLEAAIVAERADEVCSVLAIEHNLGFAGGNNAALDFYGRTAGRAGGNPCPDYLWLLNPDTIAQPAALGPLHRFLEENPLAGLAGGRCLRSDQTVRPSAFRFPDPCSELLSALDIGTLRRWLWRSDILMPMTDQPFRADWLSGAHLLVRRSVIERIGGLDERYFLYFEDIDYCARANAAGFESWHVPTSCIVHLGGGATGLHERGETRRRPRYWFASRARFLLRHHGVARAHLANLLWLLATPIGRLWAHLRRRPREEPPRLWRDFLSHNYGAAGLMYRTDELMA